MTVIKSRPLKLNSFLLNQLIVHIVKETVSPPIQRPVMVSSMPSHRENPTPAPTAIVQTGQTAKAFPEKKKNPKNANNKLDFFCSIENLKYFNSIIIAYFHRKRMFFVVG